jgi:hypothetical protein
VSQIISIAKSRNEFVQDVDGFFYWWPNSGHGGHLAAHHLRTLADELDRLNADWNAEIDKYFSEG